MPELSAIAAELVPHAKKISALRAWVGFDGTVDHIVDAVERRAGTGADYTPIATITDFSRRIAAAAGLSTNIELFQKRQKVGGNAAIMASGLVAGGAAVQLVATVGSKNHLHSVFSDLARHAQLVPLGEPSQTHAVEFSDGKIMLGYTQNLEAVTFANLQKTCSSKLKSSLERADIIALVNWTMTPAMTDILRSLATQILPSLKKESRRRRVFFFDLADPQKRPPAELKEVLLLLKSFTLAGRVVLGVNLKEAAQCARVLGLAEPVDTPDSLRAGARALRAALEIDTVVIHAVDSAAAATDSGEDWQVGPRVATPRLRTGAGDHFNSGFAIAEALGVSPLARLTLAVAFSGFYVGEARSPSFTEALDLIKKGW